MGPRLNFGASGSVRGSNAKFPHWEEAQPWPRSPSELGKGGACACSLNGSRSKEQVQQEATEMRCGLIAQQRQFSKKHLFHGVHDLYF